MKFAKYSVLLVLILMLGPACSLFMPPEKADDSIPVERITIDEEAVYAAVDQIVIINVDIYPTHYSENIDIDNSTPEVASATLDNNLLTITGAAIGSTLIRLRSENVTQAIAVNIVSDESINPDIYLVASDPIISIDLDETKTTSVALFGNTSNYGYSWQITDPDIAQIDPNQKSAVITPLHPGSTLINVSHTSTDYGCQILLMVGNDPAETERIISCNQNIIQMYDDAVNKTISVSLLNGEEAEKSGFTFTIENPAIASAVSNNDEAVITPASAGLTYLTVSHPNAQHDLRILIYVISREFLSYIETDRNYIELSGTREEITANIVGPGDEAEIVWASNDTSIARVYGYGENAYIEGGSIAGETTIEVSHHGMRAVTTIYIVNTPNYNEEDNNEDTELITSTNYMRIVAGQSKYFYLRASSREGLSQSRVNPIGTVNEGMACFIEDPGIATIEETTTGEEYRIIGITTGTTTITFRNEDTDKTAELKVVVYPEGTDLNSLDTPYLSTTTNAIFLDQTTAYRTITVEMEGAFGTLQQYAANPENFIEWNLNLANIVEIIPNGNKATIRPLNIGECWLQISHPESSNVINVSIVVEGSPDDILDPYITTSDNIVTVVANGLFKDISVQGMGISTTTGYSWSMSDITVATAETTGSPSARIRGLRAGTATLTVTQPEAEDPLPIIVDVLPEGSVVTNDPYITTAQNIVSAVAEGGIENITVTLRNGSTADNGDFTWAVSDNTLMNLTASNNQAELTVTQAGHGDITVSHPLAARDFVIAVKAYEIAPDGSIVDEYGNVISAGDNGTSSVVPYITTEQDFMYVVASGDSQILEVRGIGIDKTIPYTWEVGNDEILTLTPYSDRAVLQGISEGETSIAISHPEAPFPLEVIVQVLPEGSTIPDTPYISSGSNVVSLSPGGSSKNIVVTLFGGTSSDYADFIWTNNNPELFSITANGKYGTISPLAIGQGTITVSHPLATRAYTIKVVVTDGTSGEIGPYITTNQEIYKIEKNEAVSITATLKNVSANQQSNFTWSTEDSEILVTANGNTGYINATDAAGVYIVTISHPLAGIDKTVTIIVNSQDPGDLSDPELIAGNYITLGKQFILSENDSNIPLTATLHGGSESDKNDFEWALDNNSSITITKNAQSIMIHPFASGTTKITASHPLSPYDAYITVIVALPGDNISLNDIVFIENSNQFIKVVEGSTSQALSVNLIGGTVTDNAAFVWTVEDSSIAEVEENGNTAIVKGKNPGQTRIRITHPLSDYDTYIVVTVTEKPIGTELYFESSRDIIMLTMADTDEQIEVDLKNATAIDLNNIVWETDNPNVVNLTSIRNIASLTPLGEGTALVTASHPLSNNNISFRVNVSEYFDFSFAKSAETIDKGESKFIAIRVPSYSTVPTTISYSSSDTDVATVDGTVEMAEITGTAPGLATITATSNHGEQAQILVRVNDSEGPQEDEIYVTSNKTTIDVDEGRSPFSVTASLVGGTDLQEQGIIWTSSDTSVFSILGSGPSVIITPKGAGEATITISHPLSETTHIIYGRVNGVVYPLTLDDVYLQVQEGKTVELTATLDSGTPSAYEKIQWTSSDPSIARISGYGKTVTIIGEDGGNAFITAQYPGGNARQCEVDVDPNPYLTFNSSSVVQVEPGASIIIPYSHNPEELPVSFVSSDPTIASLTVDQENEKLTVYGNDTGQVLITGQVSGVQASLTVNVQQAYTVGATISSISGSPRQFTFNYSVYPSNSNITVTSSNDSVITTSINSSTHTVTVIPHGTGQGFLTLKNNTAVLNIPFNFSIPANMSYSLHILDAVGSTRTTNTYISGDTIHLRDGENVFIEIVPSNSFVDVDIISVSVEPDLVDAAANDTRAWYQYNGGNSKNKRKTAAWGSSAYSGFATTLNGKIVNLSTPDKSFLTQIYNWVVVGGGESGDYYDWVYGGSEIHDGDKTYQEMMKLLVTYREGGTLKTMDYSIDYNIFSEAP